MLKFVNPQSPRELSPKSAASGWEGDPANAYESEIQSENGGFDKKKTTIHAMNKINTY